MDNACHLPDQFAHTPPKIERSSADIIAGAPTVEKIIADAENQKAIARFLGNLEQKCGANEEALKNVSVSIYRVQSDIESINGVPVFVVSDKKTGKVLSYHLEDGTCLLELSKGLNPTRIAIDNAVSSQT